MWKVFRRRGDISPERWLIEGSFADVDPLAIRRINVCIICVATEQEKSRTIWNGSHLLSLSSLHQTLLSRLFILLSLLEESLRDLDGLLDRGLWLSERYGPSSTKTDQGGRNTIMGWSEHYKWLSRLAYARQRHYGILRISTVLAHCSQRRLSDGPVRKSVTKLQSRNGHISATSSTTCC